MALVFGTNFSTHAGEVADALALFAAARSEPLVVCHVLPADSLERLGAPLRALVEGALEREVERLRQRGAQVVGTVRVGELHAELDAVAQAQGARLIAVTAASEQAPLFGVDLHATRMLTAGSPPLLVVRDPAPLRDWLEQRRPLSIVLGMDASAASATALEWVKNLAQLAPVTLTAVHLYWPPSAAERLGFPRPQFFLERLPRVEQLLREEMERRLAGMAPLHPKVRIEPWYGRMADQLVRIAEEEGAALLVVGSHRRRGLGRLGSVAHHALRLATTSVAVVPPPARAVRAPTAEKRVQRVLVATDFSRAGNAAIGVARTVLAPGGTLVLVHVARDGEGSHGEVLERLRALVPAEDRTSCAVAVLEAPRGDSVATRILQEAERRDVDALCLGTRGRSTLARTLVGSVATEVLAKSHRPTLLVRSAEE